MSAQAETLIRELVSTECRCGRAKKSRQTFCRSCYFSLPREMQANLYRLVGEGYEEAYEAAVQYFDRKKGASAS